MGVKMEKLCEFAQDKSIGVYINVVCSKTNEFCTMIRYCTLKQCPVMTSTYNKYGCKLKKSTGEEMGRKKTYQKKEQKPIIIFDESGIKSEIVCKVNYSKNNKTSLQYSMNGNLYNITVDGVFTGIVKVFYRGILTKDNIISVTQL